MRVEQILNAIANYCQDEQLIFQVIVRDTEAHVYINRQTEAEIDHFELKDNIVTAVCDLSNLNLDELYLYSRVAGIEPDWQTSINLTSTDLDEAVSDRDNNLESKVDNHSNITQADADASDLLGDRDEENEREIGDVEQTNLKEGDPIVRTVCFFYRV